MKKKILIATSVDAEKDAILRGLGDTQEIDVVVVGVGSAKAAANTAIALAKKSYDLVINAGIGGGFRDQTNIGSLVIANSIICADLGAESLDGFISVDELGFGTSKYMLNTNLVQTTYSALKSAQFPVSVGPILTVSTTTGTEQTLHRLKERYPDAVVEGMEGYGVCVASHEFGIPCLEIRAISNFVGPRDRDSWKIPEALKVLQLISPILQEVL